MDQEIKIRSGNSSSSIFQDALYIRRKVFTEEQNIAPDLEYDDQDAVAQHFVAYLRTIPVATMRIVINKTKGHLGRVATLKAYRHRGIAAELLNYIEKIEKTAGITKIEMGAQLTAIPFYEKSGYTSFGDIFLDAGIKHRKMFKELI